MAISLTNVAKYYKGEQHQKEALKWLEGQIDESILMQFSDKWRNPEEQVVESRVPASAISIIKEFEGCHLAAYPDPLSGNLPITAGWGSTKKLDGSPFYLGEVLTRDEAEALLCNQVQTDYYDVLARTVPYWSIMTEGQRAALTSFAYNLGASFYMAEGFTTISRLLRDRNWDLVPTALELYVNPGSNVEAGLRRRRQAEGKLWVN